MTINVSVKGDSKEGEPIKEMLNKEGKEFIKDLLKQYVDSLQIEFSKGMILPPKDGVGSDKIKTVSSGFNKKVNMQPVISNSNARIELVDTGILEMKEKFQCRAKDLFDALTRQEMVMAFTRSEIKLEPVQGGKFELFGGNIYGSFIELIPGEKIVQTWRYKQWPTEHYSTVSISFVEKRRFHSCRSVAIPEDLSSLDYPPPQCDSDSCNFKKWFNVNIVLICSCSAFIIMYFYYGLAEIQSELCIIKEELCPGASTNSEKLNSIEKNLQASRIRGHGDGVSNMQDAIGKALQEYDADKTAKADFALESTGGSIVSTGEQTEPFESIARSVTLFGFQICEGSNGPRQIIQPNVLPGECWAFKGPKGSVVLKLLGPVFIDGVSLEHISKSISPTGQIDTAPENFSVKGLECENGHGELLGQFIYDKNGPSLQHYEISTVLKSYEFVEFEVHSNHGNPIFTCVYRLRVHGTLDLSKGDY
ncbi:hypothetical protein FQA39_LY06256 [Lamprigera yunnana]|nr:hypothetical protein FQA39_LY06256 [Lamprigera yunnana]